MPLPHPPPTRPVPRAVVLLVLAALTTVAGFEAAELYRFYLGQDRLPMWDMASNGWGGVELLRALTEGRPLRFLDLLNQQDKWPFGFSLLLMPFLAAGGWSFASATLLSAVLFALVPALLLYVAREVDRGPAGLWGGLLASALFLASPLLRLFGVLIMREMAGVVFSLLTFGLYLRARRLGSLWAWRLAGLGFLGLVLIKYNYALILGLSLLANEVWRLPAETRRGLARKVARLLWPWPTRRPGRILLAVFLSLLVLAVLLGINPGVGVYAGLVVGAVALALGYRRDPERFRSRWRALPVEARAVLATVVAPLWIWCLSPNPIHPKEIAAFLRNRAAGPPLFSADSLLFYLRSLARDYSPASWLGAAVGVLLLAALIWLWKGPESLRALALTALLSFLLPTFHPYKEARFFATSAPFALLVAGLAVSLLLHSVPRSRTLLGGLACIAVLAGIFHSAQGADLPRRLARDYRLYSAPPALAKPLLLLTRRAAGAPRVAVLGTFNELSDSLVRWGLAKSPISRKTEVVDALARPRNTSPEEIETRLQKWISETRPRRILAIRLTPESPFRGEDYQRYNAWQLTAISALEKNPRWRVIRQREIGRRREVELLDFIPVRRRQ